MGRQETPRRSWFGGRISVVFAQMRSLASFRNSPNTFSFATEAQRSFTRNTLPDSSPREVRPGGTGACFSLPTYLNRATHLLPEPFFLYASSAKTAAKAVRESLIEVALSGRVGGSRSDKSI